MSLSDLASLGSFVSALAVLASLVYLSLQIRQNTKHSQALIQQGRAGRIADSALRLAEFRGIDGIDKCFDGKNDVTAQDVGRFLFICRAIFVSSEDSYFQNRKGLLDETAFQAFETSVRAGMGAPGLAAGWLMTRDMYEPGFRAYMDSMMGDLNGRSAPGSRGLERWKQTLAQISRPAAP